MFVCCECWVLSGRGLCDGLITRSEESYRLWRVVVCDQETPNTSRLKPATGLWKTTTMSCNARKTNLFPWRYKQTYRLNKLHSLTILLYFHCAFHCDVFRHSHVAIYRQFLLAQKSWTEHTNTELRVFRITNKPWKFNNTCIL
jgi:hypothetical protein